MMNTNNQEKARAVQEMFGRIAPRYDLMNRLMTGGMDVRLRKIVIQKTQLPSEGRLLDLGAGTGDLAVEAHRQYPQAKITAADFTLGMMQAGQKRPGHHPDFSAADALNVPFPAETFEAVVSGFLLRNVVDLEAALQEQKRILKPGGFFVALDTTKPKKNSLLSPFIAFHMHKVIPFLGQLLTGDRDAYVYLPTTSENFLTAEDLSARLSHAGFQDVGYKRYMFNTVAIHWGRKQGK